MFNYMRFKRYHTQSFESEIMKLNSSATISIKQNKKRFNFVHVQHLILLVLNSFYLLQNNSY